MVMLEDERMMEDPHREGGWTRRSVLDEPRLSEVVDAYRFLGLDVKVVDIGPGMDEDCTTCLVGSPERYRMVYTRRPTEVEDGLPVDELFD